jgi:hypothetical protein
LCLSKHHLITKENVGFNPGFIPMWPAYTAKVFEVEKGRHIRYTSPVQRGVHLVVDLTLNHKGGVTLVNEYIEITTNPIIAKVFLGILKKTHLEVFSKLGAYGCFALIMHAIFSTVDCLG